AGRVLVVMPTGSAAPDYYGVLRLGDNRYANSIVALRASTGKLVWAFQTVHHDLWDYDNASPPALVTLTRGGDSLPAVVQATKTGMLFVLNRETGKPSFPTEERPVPASDIPGEQASRSQPFTAVTPPLSPHRFSIDSIWGTSDADRAACHAAIDSLRKEGIFTPPSVRGTFVMPSNIGGAHWGGVAVDPVRQIAVVPVNRVAAVGQLIPRAGLDTARAMADDKRLGRDYQYNGMEGTPYVMRRRILLSPGGLPCTPPPFGTLVAIDLKAGGRLWEVPLGSPARLLPPEQAAKIPAERGSPSRGGGWRRVGSGRLRGGVPAQGRVTKAPIAFASRVAAPACQPRNRCGSISSSSIKTRCPSRSTPSTRAYTGSPGAAAMTASASATSVGGGAMVTAEPPNSHCTR